MMIFFYGYLNMMWDVNLKGFSKKRFMQCLFVGVQSLLNP